MCVFTIFISTRIESVYEISKQRGSSFEGDALRRCCGVRLRDLLCGWRGDACRDLGASRRGGVRLRDLVSDRRGDACRDLGASRNCGILLRDLLCWKYVLLHFNWEMNPI